MAYKQSIGRDPNIPHHEIQGGEIMPNEYGFTPKRYAPHHLDKDDPGCSHEKYEELLARKKLIEANNKFIDRVKKVYGYVEPYEVKKLIPVIPKEIKIPRKTISDEMESVYEIYKLFDLTNPNN